MKAPGRPAAGQQPDRTTAGTLHGDRVFLRFWTAASVSLAGTLVTGVVLPILVYQLTGSAWQTSLLLVIETVPYLAFGLIAGAVADRLDRRRLMWRCELASGALLASIPAAHAIGALGIGQVYVVALGTATMFVWFDAANFGALPAVVGRERIATAWAWTSSTSSVLQIAAPALGGVLAATIGPAPSITIDAVSCVISALLLMSIGRPFSVGGSRQAARLRQRVREGLTFLWHQPVVRSLTLLGFGNSFTLGAVAGLIVVDANRQLGLPRTSALIGVLYASGAAGALLASIATPRLMRRLDVLVIRLACLAVEIALVLAYALATDVVAAMACYLGLNAASSTGILTGIIYRQQVTPGHLQGRVNVIARMIAWGGQPFGAAAAGIIASTISVRAALLTAGLGVTASLLLCLAGPLRVTASGQATRKGPEASQRGSDAA